MLDALTAMGLFEKAGELYQNTALSNKYLVKGRELFIGEHLIISNRTTGFIDLDIVKLVKEGPNSGYEDTQGLEAYDMSEWSIIIEKVNRIAFYKRRFFRLLS
ncbi:hypothetical protein [Desulfosporosinus nitroreducens]|uniref:Uncharacterized protein n=1 Tax=Desulfosporosinus nitroreducens TaxID=2018668 RepID=A0ABT8QMZ9_9FIRM|nr:hypothetical protein [Desulfosporosinus nitroreducens]MCO1603308.1 hypothetical protein [Desulfosporosinus nitroreducens]MDO0822713.1 hypothetical protein [Desulfosporosinus nitroreducens]